MAPTTLIILLLVASICTIHQDDQHRHPTSGDFYEVLAGRIVNTALELNIGCQVMLEPGVSQQAKSHELETTALVNMTYMTFAHQTASDCCLSTKDKTIPYKNVKCYIQQTTTQGCYINAIVFLTQKHKHLCAPTNSPWVKELMAKLDKNKPHLKKYCSR